ncbi:MAG: divergent polysaccharide deacetylase family protein [Calditrichota bacterium]
MNRRNSKTARLYFIFGLLAIAVGLTCYLLIYNDEFYQRLWGEDDYTLGMESKDSPGTTPQDWFEPEFEFDSQTGPSPQVPWIAIIIDDFGPTWHPAIVKGFYELPYDLTLSIIPGNRNSVKTAQAAGAQGKECFLHLPMEPTDSIALDERDMIYTGMTAEQIKVVLDRAVKEIPLAVGVNNHMGSKATADPEIMTLLASELKNRNLQFVDSRTTLGSCGLSCMREQGIPALGRDIFLDFMPDEDHIKEQLEQLTKIARNRGWALGIGHVRAKTLKTLRHELPRVVNEGIRIVSAGCLVETIQKGRMRSREQAP